VERNKFLHGLHAMPFGCRRLAFIQTHDERDTLAYSSSR
jgi:hypothetical protein